MWYLGIIPWLTAAYRCIIPHDHLTKMYSPEGLHRLMGVFGSRTLQTYNSPSVQQENNMENIENNFTFPETCESVFFESKQYFREETISIRAQNSG